MMCLRSMVVVVSAKKINSLAPNYAPIPSFFHRLTAPSVCFQQTSRAVGTGCYVHANAFYFQRRPTDVNILTKFSLKHGHVTMHCPCAFNDTNTIIKYYVFILGLNSESSQVSQTRQLACFATRYE